MAKSINTKKVPNLRFPGFEEEWEETTFGEIATNKSLKFNPEKSIVSVKCIELEHISGNNGELLGFIDGSQSGSIKNVFCEGDILFGKLRPYLRKYLQAPFDGVCSSEIWVLRGKIVTNSFLYQIVQTDKFIDLANQSSGSKMPRADWNVVIDGAFSFPTSGEQEKISKFLITLDERIRTQNKIIQRLETLINELRERLFTAKLRFKKPNGEDFAAWQFEKLGGVTFKVDKKNKQRERLPVYSVSNINGFVPQSEQFDNVDSNDRGYDIGLYKIVEPQTFVYNPARINVGSIAYSGDLKKTIVSSLYVCFKTVSSLVDDFFKHFLQTEFFKNEVLKKGEGGVRIYLFFENFAQIKISLPCREEQVCISNFLSSLSQKINLEKSLLEKYTVQKKYLLANLFI